MSLSLTLSRPLWAYLRWTERSTDQCQWKIVNLDENYEFAFDLCEQTLIFHVTIDLQGRMFCVRSTGATTTPPGGQNNEAGNQGGSNTAIPPSNDPSNTVIITLVNSLVAH